jgi:hypothetical protein
LDEHGLAHLRYAPIAVESLNGRQIITLPYFWIAPDSR